MMDVRCHLRWISSFIVHSGRKLEAVARMTSINHCHRETPWDGRKTANLLWGEEVWTCPLTGTSPRCEAGSDAALKVKVRCQGVMNAVRTPSISALLARREVTSPSAAAVASWRVQVRITSAVFILPRPSASSVSSNLQTHLQLYMPSGEISIISVQRKSTWLRISYKIWIP